MKYFEKFSPASQFLYFCSVLLFMMFLQNPVILLIGVFSALLILMFLPGKLNYTDIEFLLLILVICTFLNPIFSHNGVTVLFFLNGKAITFESLLYGMNFGLLLCSVILWFKIFSIVFGTERFLSLFSSKIPKTALIISVSMHFIPLFIRRYRDIRATQEMLGQNREKNVFKNIKNHLQSFSALISWAFEASIQCSDSMSARGYSSGKRSNYKAFRHHLRDTVLIALVIVISTVILTGISLDKLSYSFYPKFEIVKPSFLSFVSYFLYFILCTAPLLCQIKLTKKRGQLW